MSNRRFYIILLLSFLENHKIYSHFRAAIIFCEQEFESDSCCELQ